MTWIFKSSHLLKDLISHKQHESLKFTTVMVLGQLNLTECRDNNKLCLKMKVPTNMHTQMQMAHNYNDASATAHEQ